MYEIECVAPLMEQCYLKSLNISSGPLPNPDTKTEVHIDFHVDISEALEGSSKRLLSLRLQMGNDDDVFYSLESISVGVFAFPASMSADEVITYLEDIGVKEVFASTRTMLDGVTSFFQHGSIGFPPIPITRNGIE